MHTQNLRVKTLSTWISIIMRSLHPSYQLNIDSMFFFDWISDQDAAAVYGPPHDRCNGGHCCLDYSSLDLPPLRHSPLWTPSTIIILDSGVKASISLVTHLSFGTRGIAIASTISSIYCRWVNETNINLRRFYELVSDDIDFWWRDKVEHCSKILPLMGNWSLWSL